jgi:hypothetical protein
LSEPALLNVKNVTRNTSGYFLVCANLFITIITNLLGINLERTPNNVENEETRSRTRWAFAFIEAFPLKGEAVREKAG